MTSLRARADDVPSAPWRSTVSAVLWLHRATPAAAALLPPGLTGRPRIPLTVGGLVAYRRSPVGPYRELFGALVVLGGRLPVLHVPFMAVDSAPSIAGGRRNWALPKTAARFDGDPGRPGSFAARGEGWELTVSVRARPRGLPAWGEVRCVQAWPDGQLRAFTVQLGGWVRPASVDIAHAKRSALGPWLAEGRHPAVVVAGRQTVLPPAGRPQARAAS